MARAVQQDARRIEIPRIDFLEPHEHQRFDFNNLRPCDPALVGWFMWRDRVMIRCECGLTMSLPHAIGKDGTVSPSIYHPATDHADCGFHVFGRLKDWRGGALPERG